MGDAHHTIPAATLAAVPEVAAGLAAFAGAAKHFLKALRQTGGEHGDDRRFAELGGLSPFRSLLGIVRCDGRILVGVDDKITGGPAFRTGFGPTDPDREALEDDGADLAAEEESRPLRPWRLFQFAALVQEAAIHV